MYVLILFYEMVYINILDIKGYVHSFYFIVTLVQTHNILILGKKFPIQNKEGESNGLRTSG
jgi:hypothetical protein